MAGIQKATQSDSDLGTTTELNRRFAKALHTLKNHNFLGAKALYELPWYILIGPPGAGKTTALVNSGLHFPLAKITGPGALQGVAGTRHCDWWFTNEAVLIDTAGRYITQDSHQKSDSAAWLAFLRLLRRHRPRRPINGAIVSVSLQDLLTQDEQERQRHACTVRERLDELGAHLGMRVPVYMLLTKADLISGFSEYFADLDKPAREQVWGVYLPGATPHDAVPAFGLLRSELEQLTRTLYTGLVMRLHQERDARRRTRIAAFPQQFESAQILALDFVQQVFAPNHFRIQPVLRSMYFTSAVQDGMTVDRLMNAVTASFGFDREVSRLHDSSGKSYFLTQLFSHVIFPEAELAGGQSRFERGIGWLRRAVVSLLAASSFGLAISWAGDLASHSTYIAAVEEKAEGIVALTSDGFLERLRGLDALYELSQVPRNDPPGEMRLAHADQQVQQASQQAYQHQLQIQLLPHLLGSLETSLKDSEPSELYEPLQMYLMFQHSDRLDTVRMQTWFNDYWAARTNLTPEQRQSLQLHISHLLQTPLRPQSLDAGLIDATRAKLLAIPIAERVYARLQKHPVFGRKINLLDRMDENFVNSYRLDGDTQRYLQIPLMFMEEGFRLMDFSPESALFSGLFEEPWVLGNDEQTLSHPHEVIGQVQAIFMADCAQAWADLYQHMHLVEFQNLTHAAEVLVALADRNSSPLLTLLTLRQGNTRFASTGSETGNRSNPRLTDVNAWLADNSRRLRLMEQIQQLHDDVADIAASSRASAMAFEAVRARFMALSSSIDSLRVFADGSPEPLATWLDQLSAQTWSLLVDAARTHAQDEWQKTVLAHWEQVAGLYPLNSNAIGEATPAAINALFGPEGVLNIYVNRFVAPFVQSGHIWRNRELDGSSLNFSRDFLRQLQHAMNIRDRISGRRAALSLVWQIRPDAMDPNLARFTLEQGTERLIYSHGPRLWHSLNGWDGGEKPLQLKFERIEGPQHLENYQGPWAWLRLLDKADIENRGDHYLVTLARDTSQTAAVILAVKAGSANPVEWHRLFSALHLPETI